MKAIKNIGTLILMLVMVLSCGKKDKDFEIKIDDWPTGGASKGLNFAFEGTWLASPYISFSFMPDGTDISGTPSCLFAHMNAVAPTAVWQREYARALGSWAEVANINFHLVSDDGSPNETVGWVQGDPRFGDLRLGMQCPGTGLAWTNVPRSETYGSTNSSNNILKWVLYLRYRCQHRLLFRPFARIRA